MYPLWGMKVSFAVHTVDCVCDIIIFYEHIVLVSVSICLSSQWHWQTQWVAYKNSKLGRQNSVWLSLTCGLVPVFWWDSWTNTLALSAEYQLREVQMSIWPEKIQNHEWVSKVSETNLCVWLCDCPKYNTMGFFFCIVTDTRSNTESDKSMTHQCFINTRPFGKWKTTSLKNEISPKLP